jgi:hypothetical protein
LKYFIILCLFISTNAHNSEIDRLEIVRKVVKKLQPRLDTKQSKVIAKAIMTSSDRYQLDWRVLASILFQESSFKADPQGCYKNMKRCSDYGMGQIHYSVWGKRLGLDRKRLVTDVSYNIDSAARVLSILKGRYGHEKQWHSRYHSSTKKHRQDYANKIYPNVKRITRYVSN